MQSINKFKYGLKPIKNTFLKDFLNTKIKTYRIIFINPNYIPNLSINNMNWKKPLFFSNIIKQPNKKINNHYTTEDLLSSNYFFGTHKIEFI